MILFDFLPEALLALDAGLGLGAVYQKRYLTGISDSFTESVCRFSSRLVIIGLGFRLNQGILDAGIHRKHRYAVGLRQLQLGLAGIHVNIAHNQGVRVFVQHLINDVDLLGYILLGRSIVGQLHFGVSCVTQRFIDICHRLLRACFYTLPEAACGILSNHRNSSAFRHLDPFHRQIINAFRFDREQLPEVFRHNLLVTFVLCLRSGLRLFLRLRCLFFRFLGLRRSLRLYLICFLLATHRASGQQPCHTQHCYKLFHFPFSCSFRRRLRLFLHRINPPMLAMTATAATIHCQISCPIQT